MGGWISAARPSCARDLRPSAPAPALRGKVRLKGRRRKVIRRTWAADPRHYSALRSLRLHSESHRVTRHRRSQKQVADLRKEEEGQAEQAGAGGALPERKGRSGVRAEAVAAPPHWPGRGGKPEQAASGRGRSLPGAPPRPRPRPAVPLLRPSRPPAGGPSEFLKWAGSCGGRTFESGRCTAPESAALRSSSPEAAVQSSAVS